MLIILKGRRHSFNFMDIQYNFDGLGKLKKEFQNKQYVKVGILSNQSTRSNDYLLSRYNKFKDDPSVPKKIKNNMLDTYHQNPNNAEVGAAMEFGVFSKKIPARSFLKMPILTKLKEKIPQIQSHFSNTVIKQGLKSTLELMGIQAKVCVQEAFQSGGFGTWAPLSPITTYLKESETIGIDTGQLSQAITSEVVTK